MDSLRYYKYPYGYQEYKTIIIYSILFFVSMLLFFLAQKIPFFLNYTGKHYKLLLFLLPFLFLLSAFRFYAHAMPSVLEEMAEQGAKGMLTGKVCKVTETEKGSRIILKNIVFKEENKKSIQGKRGNIMLYDSSGTDVRTGNTIIAMAELQNFRRASNPGQYDEYKYQKSHGNDIAAYSDELTVVNKKIECLSYALQLLRDRLARVYDKILKEKEASVMKAMVLGEKSGLDKDIRELYSRNGIAHILAISGLHISILGFIFYRGVRILVSKTAFFFSSFFSAVAAVIFVFSYVKMIGSGVSANRALVMFFLSLLAGLVGRTYDLLTGTAIAALILLFREPLLIYDSGFWLSFGAVFGIAVLLPGLRQIVPAFPVNRQSHLNQKNVRQEILKKSAGKLREGMLASTVIFLSTLPIVARTYFTYPLYGIFLNLVVIPLMSVLFPTAFFIGVFGLFWTWPASILAVFAEGILGFYEKVCLFTEKLPGAIQLTGCPAAWKVIVYYAMIGYMIFLFNKNSKDGNRNKNKNRRRVLFAGIFSVGLLYRLPSSEFQIHFLDIGQGDSIVMELPNGMAVTVDGGSSSVSSAGEYRLLPFLKAARIAEIEYAFLTHMDADHVNAIEELLKMGSEGKGNGYIKNLIVPAVLKERESWQEMKALAKKKGVCIFYMEAGDEFELKGVRFRCLHPGKEDNEDSENAASLVLKVSYGKLDLLLTGDVEGNGEKSLIENYPEDIKGMDMLKVAHHGSKNSTSEEFLSICQPKISIISCGKGNRYGHPHQETLEKLQNIGSKIMITRDCGEIMIRTDGKKVEIREYLL